MDKREHYSGPDAIAYLLIPGFLKLVLKYPPVFHLFRRIFFPKGIYEYVIARTRYIDALFVSALKDEFKQVLLFGSGFDSRALRFDKENRNTKIFEIDAPVTQAEKAKALQKKNLKIPEKLVSVSLDFNKETLDEVMPRMGVTAGVKSLFIMEGLIMYLSKEAVKNTFRYVSGAAGPGSIVVFDHIHKGVLNREDKLYGEEKIYKTVANAGEEWTFGLGTEEVAELLAGYGFSIIDHSDAAELERRYFTNASGDTVARMNATHAIVTAVKN